VHQIALSLISSRPGAKVTMTSNICVVNGQISGSVDARESLLQQHLTADPSLFVIYQLEPSLASLRHQHVTAWVVKFANSVLANAIELKRDVPPCIHDHLADQKKALLTTAVKRSLLGRSGKRRPLDSDIRDVQRVKSGLHPKAGAAMHGFLGLERLAAYAIKPVLVDAVIRRLSPSRALELASALAMSEALAISSGHPLVWNSKILTDGVVARVGTCVVKWSAQPLSDARLSVMVLDTRSSCILSILQCTEGGKPEDENEAIRQATETLVMLCREASYSHPLAKETPLTRCVVVLEKLVLFNRNRLDPEGLVITDFEGLSSGCLLPLAHRIFKGQTSSNDLP
jgi:hypothetical protein